MHSVSALGNDTHAGILYGDVQAEVNAGVRLMETVIGYHIALICGLVVLHFLIKLLLCRIARAVRISYALWFVIAGFCIGLGIYWW